MPKSLLFSFLLLCTLSATAQNYSSSDSTSVLSLEQCLQYAIKHQPALKQSYIDEQIAGATNRIGLSAGLPQVGLNANYQHYFQLPTTFTVNPADPNGQRINIKTGVTNTLLPTFGATQALFSNDVLFAIRAAPLNTKAAKQNTEAVRIDVISNVSKAYYDVLLTQAQIIVLAEDTARLGKNLRDAYSQYQAGIVDKVDYKRASISLNNSIADLKNAGENINAKAAVLKQLMGYPQERNIALTADTVQMMQNIIYDTTEAIDYEHRIEYRELETQANLQRETTAYYRYSFLPNLSAFFNYVPEYETNNSNSELFNTVYPYSNYGLTLSFPIFTGLRRVNQIRRSRLQETRRNLDLENLRLQIFTEYRQALTNYKNNLTEYYTLQENVKTAQEVYDVVKLQYREGIKQYLEVITAEADLRTSEINYLNALYMLLQSKVDLQRALGDIDTNP